MTEHNLQALYRQPEIFIKLPNGGQFYPEGTLELSATGDIPVFSLSARDDIMLKTPDALISGEAVVSVIQNCIPNILDAWKMPAIDINYLMVALRIATYGENMTLDSTCPKCEVESTFDVDLNFYIDQLMSRTLSDDSVTVKHKDLTIKLKPMSYYDFSIFQKRTLEEQKAIMLTGDADSPLTTDEKNLRYSEILKNMTNLNFELISSGVDSITLPDGTVIADKETIVTFVDDAPIAVFKRIDKAITKIRESSNLDNLKLSCKECEHEYESPLIFDYSSFFA